MDVGHVKFFVKTRAIGRLKKVEIKKVRELMLPSN
jgi:hypothetical protein